MCLLVPVDALPLNRGPRPDRLQSIFKRDTDDCQAGNLLQIHFGGGKTQAKCDGTSTNSSKTSKSEQKLHEETFVSATMCPQQCVLVCQGLKVKCYL